MSGTDLLVLKVSEIKEGQSQGELDRGRGNARFSVAYLIAYPSLIYYMQQNIYSLLHLAQMEFVGNPEFFIKKRSSLTCVFK